MWKGYIRMKIMIILALTTIGCASTGTHTHNDVCVSNFVRTQRTLDSYKRLVDKLSDKVKELGFRLNERRKITASEPIGKDSRILYLTLPTSPKEEPRYTVVKYGDSFWTISIKNNVDAYKLLRANPIFDRRKIDGVIDKARHNKGWDPDYLKPGDKVILP